MIDIETRTSTVALLVTAPAPQHNSADRIAATAAKAWRLAAIRRLVVVVHARPLLA